MRAGAALLIGLLALPGCAASRASTPSATLPPDSLELLRQALDRVRPAYDTQAEALRAGVYAGVAGEPAAGQADATPLGRPVAPRPVAPAPEPESAPARPRPEQPARPEPAAPRPAPDPEARPTQPAADPAAPAAPVPDAVHAYVVQIAAFRDEASARAAAADALRTFPRLVPVLEAADGWFRVALAGWSTEDAARAALPAIHTIYPGAWLRPRSVP